jgi:hypothetical protein
LPAFSLLTPLFCCSILAIPCLAQAGQAMPRIEGESFAGRKVVLPDAASGKVAALILGFSKGSKGPTSAWGEKAGSEFGSHPGFELYQLPVLEDVPRLFRGMVISGIKKGVKENARDHFVPIVQGEASLKKLVGYKEADDAYIIILDRSGQIFGQMHGEFSETLYAQFSAQVQKLLGH